ncbi:UDP-2,3-diacylglucosamine diphosphatase [Paludisphaera mucosa]|uniref:UDP-2,3-diacylglucosamine diphosphatase n=1 Tax=Paludisphaera mucosa TaxID=3030827 RepID=A0ABT6FAT4_9BACT|nr:UDP-2,3-diacylglucosamine diphosphatase [Paludisphaera mucosa]MDG3004702.1 UDP-2,3-diacylglucosamine diphosphatase [Paludisphaera mucosa]
MQRDLERRQGQPLRRYDCLVISDLHLGSDVCQAKPLAEFLGWAAENSRELVINGDIFDDLNFSRLSKSHFACLKAIRRHSDRDDFRVSWIRGNHDGPADVVAHIVGVDVLDEYYFENERLRLLILHGDQFDRFVENYGLLTEAACRVYYYIQKWAPHHASRYIRRVSKKFQRSSEMIRDGAVAYAASKGCRYVVCGHTHLAGVEEVRGVLYANSGTWTEHLPCPFVSVRGDEVRLEYWPPAEAEGEADDASAGFDREEESAMACPSAAEPQHLAPFRILDRFLQLFPLGHSQKAGSPL